MTGKQDKRGATKKLGPLALLFYFGVMIPKFAIVLVFFFAVSDLGAHRSECDGILGLVSGAAIKNQGTILVFGMNRNSSVRYSLIRYQRRSYLLLDRLSRSGNEIEESRIVPDVTRLLVPDYNQHEEGELITAVFSREGRQFIAYGIETHQHNLAAEKRYRAIDPYTSKELFPYQAQMSFTFESGVKIDSEFGTALETSKGNFLSAVPRLRSSGESPPSSFDELRAEALTPAGEWPLASGWSNLPLQTLVSREEVDITFALRKNPNGGVLLRLTLQPRSDPGSSKSNRIVEFSMRRQRRIEVSTKLPIEVFTSENGEAILAYGFSASEYSHYDNKYRYRRYKLRPFRASLRIELPSIGVTSFEATLREGERRTLSDYYDNHQLAHPGSNRPAIESSPEQFIEPIRNNH